MDEDQVSADTDSDAMAKRLALAGIGAVAAACDEAESQFDRFVRRGHEVTEEWQEKTDRTRMQGATSRERMRDSVRSMMGVFLDSFNIPTKSEVDAMNVKLNVMMRKLDDLSMERAARSTSGQPEAPSPAVPPAAPDTDLAT